VWVACSRRETIHLAAQKGIGALGFAFFDPEEAKFWVDDYYATLEAEGVPVGDAVNAQIACVTPYLCHPDEEQAVLRAAEGVNFFGYSLGHYYIFGRHRPAETEVWSEYVERRREHGYDPEVVTAAANAGDRLGAKAITGGFMGLRGAMGTPEQVREYLRRYEQVGVDTVILSSAAGRNRHEHVMESLELFGKEILPEFAERDERLRRDKEERLAPVIEAVMARKPESDHPPLVPGFEVPAIPRAEADRSESTQFHEWLDQLEDSMVGGDDIGSDIGKHLA
jgi:alkanesulfonate monooxygenase SsuD/methylene tetrahydromethanopterin reductase-like flavin-dependent oxidoreductase (luciferase family)